MTMGPATPPHSATTPGASPRHLPCSCSRSSWCRRPRGARPPPAPLLTGPVFPFPFPSFRDRAETCSPCWRSRTRKVRSLAGVPAQLPRAGRPPSSETRVRAPSLHSGQMPSPVTAVNSLGVSRSLQAAQTQAPRWPSAYRHSSSLSSLLTDSGPPEAEPTSPSEHVPQLPQPPFSLQPNQCQSLARAGPAPPTPTPCQPGPHIRSHPGTHPKQVGERISAQRKRGRPAVQGWEALSPRAFRGSTFVCSLGTKQGCAQCVGRSLPRFRVREEKRMWLCFSKANQTQHLAKGVWNVTSNTS